MKPKSAIAKGKLLEDYVANEIRVRGLDPKATRSHGSGSGNTEKADIWTSMMVMGQNAGIECKNHKTVAIGAWWAQTQKLERLGREPILAFKLDRESLEETKVVIYLDTFLELVKASTSHSKAPRSRMDAYIDPKAKLATKKLLEATKDVLKHFDV